MTQLAETANEAWVEQVRSAEQLCLSRANRAALLFFLGLGVMSCVSEAMLGRMSHLWVSLQVNFLFWFGIAAASSCFPAVFFLSGARWQRPVERIFQAALPFFVLLSLFIVVLYFGRAHLFSWVEHPAAGKEYWLLPELVYLRDFFGAVFLCVIAWRVIAQTLSIELEQLRSRSETAANSGALQKILFQSLGGAGAADYSGAMDRKSRYAPAAVIAYAVIMSLIAFDQLMSVDAHWYSALFGVFYFMSAVYGALGAVCVLAVLFAQDNSFFRGALSPAVLHDLGKLVFGFGIFWAYLAWSHYLPIWYGNIPEETAWVIVRLREEPWHFVGWFVLGSGFIVPFFAGLSREVKRVPVLMLILGTIVLTALNLMHYLLFAPSIYPDRLPFNAADLGIALGFFAAYVLSAEWFLRRVPLAPLA
ncbi:MAG TPA: hypothetical protein PLP17_01710 [Oligoflexia bacterium]|nr:hypothetical protein [Oligoflexia bacterium]